MAGRKRRCPATLGISTDARLTPLTPHHQGPAPLQGVSRLQAASPAGETTASRVRTRPMSSGQCQGHNTASFKRRPGDSNEPYLASQGCGGGGGGGGCQEQVLLTGRWCSMSLRQLPNSEAFWHFVSNFHSGSRADQVGVAGTPFRGGS